MHLLPTLLPSLVYLVVHEVLDYGTIGAEVYADPFDAPLPSLRWVALRWPRLVADLAVCLPASSLDLADRLVGVEWFARPELRRIRHVFLAVLVLAVVAVGAAALRPSFAGDRARELRWLLVGSALAIVPLCVAPAHGRLLLLAQIGACPAIASAIVVAAQLARGTITAMLARRIVGTLFGAGLVLVHAAELRYAARTVDGLVAAQERNLLAFETEVLRGAAGKDVIVIAGQGSAIGIHGTIVMWFHGYPVPRSWQTLSFAGAPHTIRRPSKNTLRIELIGDRQWMSSAAERFFRPHTQYREGERFEGGPFVAIVRTVDENGWPRSVDFRFAAPLGDPRWLFVTSTREGLTEVELPAVGGVGMVPIPHVPAISGAVPTQPIPITGFGSRREVSEERRSE